MRLIRAIVVDLFHTLIDPEDFRPPGFRRARAMARLLGVDPDRFAACWAAGENARTRGEVDFQEMLMELVGRPLADEELTKADALYGRCQDRALLRPRPGVLEALDDLRDAELPLALLSNAEARDVRRWEDSPLATRFDVVRFSSFTGHMKPEPAAYRQVLGDLGIRAERTAFLGDGGSDELSGARRIGFGQVVFMRGFVGSNRLRSAEDLRRQEEIADLTVDRLGELVELLG